MDIEKRKKLISLLGEGFTEEELEEILEETPQLVYEAHDILEMFCEIRHEAIPRLSPDFTDQVLSRIQNGRGEKLLLEKKRGSSYGSGSYRSRTSRSANDSRASYSEMSCKGSTSSVGVAGGYLAHSKKR